MAQKSNFFLQNLKAKYERLSTRMQNAVKDGRFQSFSQNKKRSVLQSLARYERQLRQWGIAVATSAVLLIPASTVVAQTPVGTEFQVNTTTASYQSLPRMAMDDDGDYVIVWASYDQDGNEYGVFAQRYSKTGVPQGSEFQVNQETLSSQFYPLVAMDDPGNFVIAWESSDNDGNGIWARRYDSAGNPLGNEFLVNTYTTSEQRTPEITMDSDGDFIISWQSYDQDGDNYGVFVRRFDNAGNALGAEFQVNESSDYSQEYPTVAMDNDGDFVVCWSSYAANTIAGDVFARRYNNLGVAQGGEFLVNSYTTYAQFYPWVAIDADGDFVIAWNSYYQDGAYNGIYAQRYNNAGVPQGSEFKVNPDADPTNYPVVDMNNDGDFVICWGENYDGDGYGSYARSYNSAGQPRGDVFQNNTYTTGDQIFPSCAMDNAGGFIIAWESDSQDGDYSGVYAQRYEVAPVTGACDIPTGLSTTDITNNSAKLNWEATPGAIKYKIQLQNIPTGVQTTIVAGPNDINAIAASLSSDTRYRWFIKAKCPTGWTAASPWQVFRTTGAFALTGEISDIAGYSANDEALVQNDGLMVVYPNPASDMVQLTSLDQSFQSIRITDLTGRVVFERSGLNTSQLEIDIHDLANGLYHLHAQSGEQSHILPLVILK